VVEERLAVVETEVKLLRKELEEVKDLAQQTRDIVLEMKGQHHRQNGGGLSHLAEAIKWLVAALLGALGFKLAGGGQ